MAYVALFSGGKDSAYSVFLAQKAGLEISGLLTMVPRSSDSMMFHYPNANITHLHSEALGIPLIARQTNGEEGLEVSEMANALSGLDVSGIICGAVESVYQKDRVESVCRELGLELFAPLWHRDCRTILEDLLLVGFECVFSAAQAEGMGREWLGRQLDTDAISELKILSDKYGLNICGEGGEYETLALDGPNFKKKIIIDRAQVQWHRDSGIWLVESAHLEAKVSQSP